MQKLREKKGDYHAKKFYFFVTLGRFLISLILVGCSSKKKQLLGKWEEVENPNYALEFFPDGKAKACMASWLPGSQSVLLNYQIRGWCWNPVELEFHLTGSRLRLKVAGEEQLLLRSGSKEISKYREDKKKENGQDHRNKIQYSLADHSVQHHFSNDP